MHNARINGYIPPPHTHTHTHHASTFDSCVSPNGAIKSDVSNPDPCPNTTNELRSVWPSLCLNHRYSSSSIYAKTYTDRSTFVGRALVLGLLPLRRDQWQDKLQMITGSAENADTLSYTASHTSPASIRPL